jgi:hypothetical protein
LDSCRRLLSVEPACFAFGGLGRLQGLVRGFAAVLSGRGAAATVSAIVQLSDAWPSLRHLAGPPSYDGDKGGFVINFGDADIRRAHARYFAVRQLRITRSGEKSRYGSGSIRIPLCSLNRATPRKA